MCRAIFIAFLVLSLEANVAQAMEWPPAWVMKKWRECVAYLATKGE